MKRGGLCLDTEAVADVGAGVEPRVGVQGLHPATTPWQRELEDAASFADIEKLAELDEDERTELKATLEAMVARWQSMLSTLG